MTLSGRAAVLAVAILLVSLLGGRVEAGNGSRWLVGPAGAVLHAAPASTASVLDTLAPGRRLVEFERHGDWLRVFVMESVGLEGWVPAEGLEATGLTTSDRDDEAAGGDEDEDDGHGLTAPAAPFVLAVTGSPALAFSIDCRQVGSSGRERRLRAQGLVPRSFKVAGRALSCLVSKEDARGRLVVRLGRAGRSLATAETAAAYNYVRVRSDGPWGAAAAWRGAIPQVQFRPDLGGVGSDGRGASVPPLRGTIIPPLRQP